MKVVNITAGRADPVTVEVLTELLDAAREGQLVSFGYIAELRGADRPLFGVAGKYLRDPFQAMAAITRLWFKLTRMAEAKEQKHAERY